MCLVFILQPMCLLRCCIINHLKSWILIVDSSLIVKSLVHGYTLMHACYDIDGFIFFLLQHMTWYAICMLSPYTLMNIIPMLDEIIVKRGRSNVKIFWFNLEFLSFKKGEKFSFGFLSTMCTFVRSVLFTKQQNIVYEFANVFIKGEIVKSKVFFIIIMWWTIGIGDYWFCYLEFIHEVVLEMIGFTGESQVC